MSGDIEAIGDVATGAAIARVIEPSAGEGHGDGAKCLNCGTALLGRHCHGCGQSAHIHRTLGGFAHDIVHGVLHFEGKFWRTLPMIFFRPGQLTRRYINGERARFVSPFALFLFSVFLMFAAISWFGGPVKLPTDLEVNAGKSQWRADLDTELVKTRAELKTLETAPVPPGSNPAARNAKIKDMRAEVEGLENMLKIATGDAFKDYAQEKIDVNLGSPAVNAAIKTAIGHAMANPRLLLYKIQSSAYKFSWLLIPLSLPFVWLTFAWRRAFPLYDHAVFITYSLSFMTLLFVLLALLGALGPLEAVIPPLILLAPPLHMFFQLRGTYGLSVASALWRSVALLGFAVIVLQLFGLLLLAMGVSG